MVLCAGFGTRLGELTRETPKPLLPLNGRPLLEYVIAHLTRHGVEDICVNLHFMPEKIREILGDGGRWGTKIVYSEESELLGTAGALKRMQHFLRGDEAFLVQYGDILTDQDFTAMLAFHRQRHALATLLLHQRASSNSVVALDDEQRIVGFWERPDEETRSRLGSPWVNSAVCICDPALLDLIPAGIASDLPRDIFPKLVAGGRLFGFPLTGYRCAIDSPSRYADAQAAVLDGRCHVFLPKERTVDGFGT